MSAKARAVTEFAMPSLGADMTEGRITEWLVHPGDHIERGQIVVVVETDKSDIEVEVFEPGVIVELLVPEGELVPVGTPIARIEAGSVPGVRTPQPVAAAQPVPAAIEPVSDVVAEAAATHAAHGSHVTSPVLRHLAAELQVDTEQMRGSGPGGRIHRDDLLAVTALAPVRRAAGSGRRITPRGRRLLAEHGLDVAAIGRPGVITGDDVLVAVAALASAPPSARSAKPREGRADSMRRHIAALMTRSWQEIPHYHVSKRIDLTAMTDRLTTHNEGRTLDERIVPGAVLLAAAARAAAAVPACNGWWRDDRFDPASRVALGVVLSLRTGGIIVPTIDRADEITPAEMMARLTELVQRARQGRLRASDMTEASLTVTNLGDLGADSVAGVIHPPQVALLALGAVHDELWPADGAAVVRPTVHADLAGDHRAIDGLTGSRFLTQLQAQLDTLSLEVR